MASPSAAPAPQTNGHASPPPPAEPQAAAQPQPPQPQQQQQPSPPDPEVPLTSLSDDGLSKRPRDARLIHLVLSSQGINSYQERVPLQLLDFAYRYTSSVLSDSLRLASEGYAGQPERGAGKRGGGNEESQVGVTALRQALASRADYTFGGALPKDFMLGQAAERNRVALPKVDRAHGLVLPPEKYCLTGATWGLKDEWESEEDEVEAEDGMVGVVGQGEDEKMGGLDNGVQEEDEDEDEEGLGTMEDVFGEEKEGGDTDMKED